MNFEKLIVLLVVFIGVVVINIDGKIINIVLVLFKNIGEVLFIMFDQKKMEMRLLLCELKLIIIDEILMVGNIIFFYIY